MNHPLPSRVQKPGICPYQSALFLRFPPQSPQSPIVRILTAAPGSGGFPFIVNRTAVIKSISQEYLSHGKMALRNLMAIERFWA